MWEIGIRKVNFVVIRPHRLAVCWDGFICRIRTEGSPEPNFVVFVLQACVTQQNLKLVNDLCKCVLKCNGSLYRTINCLPLLCFFNSVIHFNLYRLFLKSSF